MPSCIAGNQMPGTASIGGDKSGITRSSIHSANTLRNCVTHTPRQKHLWIFASKFAAADRSRKAQLSQFNFSNGNFSSIGATRKQSGNCFLALEAVASFPCR